MINRGESPLKAEDPEVYILIKRCVIKNKTFVATYNSDCLPFEDCVVVDVQCDFGKKELGNIKSGEADMAALEDTMRTIGEKIRPNCQVLIETTVAPGTTEFVAWPILKKAFANQGSALSPYWHTALNELCPVSNMWPVSATFGEYVPDANPLQVPRYKSSFMRYSIQKSSRSR